MIGGIGTCAPESQVRIGLAAGGSRIRTCMGLFLSSGCFGLCCQFFVRSGKGRFSSRRLRSGSRSARKGSRDRNGSKLGGLPLSDACVSQRLDT